MTPAELLALLDDVARGDAGWSAACPACSTTGAVGVHVNVRGYTVIECHAGCALGKILDAIEARRAGPPPADELDG